MAAESQQHNYVFWEVQTDLHSCWTLFVYSTIHFMCLMLFWHDLVTIVTNMHFWNVCVYYIYYTMYYNYLLQHNFVTGKKIQLVSKINGRALQVAKSAYGGLIVNGARDLGPTT